MAGLSNEDNEPYGPNQWIGYELLKKARAGHELKAGDSDDPEILMAALRNACKMLRNMLEKEAQQSVDPASE